MSEETKTENQFEVKPLRSIQEIVADLKKDIHPFYLKTRKQGSSNLVYISWYDACHYMDIHAPGWSHEIIRMEKFGDKVCVTVRVSIPSIEGVTWREATGSEDEDYDTYGDTFSNGESQAIRRACAKFGLGIHLYRNPEKAIQAINAYQRGQSKPVSNPVNTSNPQTNQPPKANTNQSKPSSDVEMISEKQIAFLSKLIEKAEDDMAEAILEFTNQRTEMIDAMSKKEAMAAINHYQK